LDNVFVLLLPRPPTENLKVGLFLTGGPIAVVGANLRAQ
jgi:hypothetical protein